MKIVEIRGFELRSKLPCVQGNSTGFVDHVSTFLVAIRSDDGIVGWGETWASPATASALIRRHLAPPLLGRDPRDHGVIWHELVRQRGYDRRGNTMMAISAIDLALWDATARAHDLPVWAQARNAIVVGAGGRLRDRAARVATVERHFEPPPVARGTWLKALRLHQWAKNLLIFLPLLASHRITEVPLLVATGLAFLAFGLCASSVYILNDLMDLPSDRLHSRKRNRPSECGPRRGREVGPEKNAAKHGSVRSARADTHTRRRPACCARPVAAGSPGCGCAP